MGWSKDSAQLQFRHCSLNSCCSALPRISFFALGELFLQESHSLSPHSHSLTHSPTLTHAHTLTLSLTKGWCSVPSSEWSSWAPLTSMDRTPFFTAGCYTSWRASGAPHPDQSSHAFSLPGSPLDHPSTPAVHRRYSSCAAPHVPGVPFFSSLTCSARATIFMA